MKFINGGALNLLLEGGRVKGLRHKVCALRWYYSPVSRCPQRQTRPVTQETVALPHLIVDIPSPAAKSPPEWGNKKLADYRCGWDVSVTD